MVEDVFAPSLHTRVATGGAQLRQKDDLPDRAGVFGVVASARLDPVTGRRRRRLDRRKRPALHHRGLVSYHFRRFGRLVEEVAQGKITHTRIVRIWFEQPRQGFDRRRHRIWRHKNGSPHAACLLLYISNVPISLPERKCWCQLELCTGFPCLRRHRPTDGDQRRGDRWPNHMVEGGILSSKGRAVQGLVHPQPLARKALRLYHPVRS